MHNLLEIVANVPREWLTVTLFVEATSNEAKIVHFYSSTLDRVWHAGRSGYHIWITIRQTATRSNALVPGRFAFHQG